MSQTVFLAPPVARSPTSSLFLWQGVPQFQPTCLSCGKRSHRFTQLYAPLVRSSTGPHLSMTQWQGIPQVHAILCPWSKMFHRSTPFNALVGRSSTGSLHTPSQWQGVLQIHSTQHSLRFTQSTDLRQGIPQIHHTLLPWDKEFHRFIPLNTAVAMSPIGSPHTTSPL